MAEDNVQEIETNINLENKYYKVNINKIVLDDTSLWLYGTMFDNDKKAHDFDHEIDLRNYE